jgi:AmiR/NasT family two-component response regulator
VATLSLFATSAALAVQSTVHEQDIVNLEAALDGSRQIGRAVGIIMTRHAITSDEAFHRLRRASQDLNRKLREVAAEVELTGTLPESSSAGDITGHSARGDGA